jgi:DNA-binding Lrp family transcriptional regulator
MLKILVDFLNHSKEVIFLNILGNKTSLNYVSTCKSNSLLYANVLFSMLQISSWRCKMPSAYVLFNVSPGFEAYVLNEAKKIGGIQEAYVSYGVYDLILKVKAHTNEELKELVMFKLRRLPNVTATLTLMLNDLEVPIRTPAKRKESHPQLPPLTQLTPLYP